MTQKRRTAPEIIGFHLGWDMRDVSEGRYQRYSNPAVYVCGSDYYCAPTASQKPNSDFQWDVVGEYYGRKVYIAT
jgi:hypothetical protein